MPWYLSSLIGLGDIAHAHQLQTSEGIVHGTSHRELSIVLREGLKPRSSQVGDHVTVLDWLFTSGRVADHLDNVKTAYFDVRAFHHDVAQAQHVHAHRPHVRPAADDGDESEAQRVWAAIVRHLQP